MTWGASGSWVHQVLGGWSNLFQGAIGSLIGTLVGVVGAYLVARWTTRRELDLQRQEALRREQAEAAGRLRTALYDLWSHTQRLIPDDLVTRRDYAVRQLEAWNGLTDRYRRQVTDDGLSLPPAFQRQLTALEPLLPAFYAVDFDPTGWPIHIERAGDATIVPILASIDLAIGDLNDLRLGLHPSAPTKGRSQRRRPRLPWALVVVLSGALVLAVVLG